MRCTITVVSLVLSTLVSLAVGIDQAELDEKNRLQEEANPTQYTPAPDTTCGMFTSCAECVFDSTSGLVGSYANCTWCPSSQRCVSTVTNFSNACPDARYRGGLGREMCREMQCVAAQDWTNIYFCRPQMRAALCVAILLLLLSVLYYFWLRTLSEKPWKYRNIHDVVDDYVNSGADRSRFLKELRTNEKCATPPAQPDEEGAGGEKIECHICKVRSSNVEGDGVCFWCNIVRLAFFPLTVAVTVSCIVIILIFLVGLKPWFATPYYAVLLGLGYASYGAFFFALHTRRVPAAGDSKARLSSFVHLTLVLRGRKLKDVFPNLEECTNDSIIINPPESPQLLDEPTPTTTQPGSPKFPTATTAKPNSPAALPVQPPPPQATTVLDTHPFSTGSGIQFGASLPQFGASLPAGGLGMGNTFASFVIQRNEGPAHIDYPPVKQPVLEAALKAAIPPESREEIVWSYEPTREVIFTDQIWLFNFFASITAMGAWLLICSMVDSSWSIFNVVSSSLLGPTGSVLILLGVAALYHLWHGLARLYVLTPRRLIIFIQNGSSNAIVNDTNIEAIGCASVQTYSAFTWDKLAVVIRSFSWTAPEEGRRLPPIQSNSFVGLTPEAMFELRDKFDSVVKMSINSNAIKSDFKHLRTSWKVNIALAMLMVWLVPCFLFQAYFVPFSVAVLGLVAFASMPLCMIYRGYRIHKLSVIGHNVSKAELFLPQKPALSKNMRNIVNKILVLKTLGSPIREGVQALRQLSQRGDDLET